MGLIFFWITGCAIHGGWEPTVDPRASGSETLARDLVECKQLAKQAAGDPEKKTAIGALVGGLAGAAGGAAIGAATGNAGKGAAVGSAVGGIGAGAHQGLSADAQYKQTYMKCMEGRGHKVLN
jgi:hypothetical protein